MNEPIWSAEKFSLVRKEMGDLGVWGYYSHELGVSSNYCVETYQANKELIPELKDWELQDFMLGLAEAYDELKPTYKL